MSVRVIARVRAQAGKEASLAEALQRLVGPSNAEPGCLGYEVFVGTDDPAEFVVVETYADGDAYEAHMASPHVQGALAGFGELVDGPLDVRVYRPLG